MTNDIDELTALNLDFVASVQNSDVRRFDEILAPEFYCSNPDKSLAFLEQTAKPVAIKNLQAHDVKIRIMGHFAAANETPMKLSRTVGLAVSQKEAPQLTKREEEATEEKPKGPIKRAQQSH
jgi:hypothetical protein